MLIIARQKRARIFSCTIDNYESICFTQSFNPFVTSRTYTFQLIFFFFVVAPKGMVKPNFCVKSIGFKRDLNEFDYERVKPSTK